jgi:hypothetical protein
MLLPLQVLINLRGGSVANADNLSAGSYVITGISLSDTIAHTDSLSVGTYAVSGNSLTDTAAHNDSLSAGAYVVAGNSITDVKTGATAYSDNLSAGNYSITGQSIQDSIVPFVTVSIKQGGDDVPQRVEIWDYRNPKESVKANTKKLKQVTLDGNWLKEQVKLAKDRDTEEDDIEALLLLL